MSVRCFRKLSGCGGDSRTGQSQEAGNGQILPLFQGRRRSQDRQREAPRLPRDGDGRAAFEHVRRADLRRHGGFRRQQRGVPAPLHDAGARSPEPRHVLPAVQAAGSRAVCGGDGAVRRGLGKALGKNGGRRIAIDGKVLRRSHMCAGEMSPLHMAGALLPEAGSRSARMHHERSVEGEHPSFAAIELQAALLLEQSSRFSSASRTPRARSSAGCLGVGFASAIGPIRVASGSSVQLLTLRQTRGSSQFLRCLPECVARILFTSMLHEFPCHAA